MDAIGAVVSKICFLKMFIISQRSDVPFIDLQILRSKMCEKFSIKMSKKFGVTGICNIFAAPFNGEIVFICLKIIDLQKV